MAGPVVTVPSLRPPTAPPAGLPAVPTVVEPCGAPPADVDPDELAVPAELVPGILEAFAAFPAPLGSLPELLRPLALPGPVTPLIAAVPAPAEPALGEALLAAPEARPADDAPPAEAPPDEEPPPDPPPPLCARADTGASRAVVRMILHKATMTWAHSLFMPTRCLTRRSEEREHKHNCRLNNGATAWPLMRSSGWQIGIPSDDATRRSVVLRSCLR